MGIFKKKKEAVPSVVPVAAPEESETPAEVEYVEQLDSPQTPTPQVAQQPTTTPQPQPMEYREVPVCLSETQINNLIIENNIMLKQIIAEID